jgi:hypothetical protein
MGSERTCLVPVWHVYVSPGHGLPEARKPPAWRPFYSIFSSFLLIHLRPSGLWRTSFLLYFLW